MIYCHEGSLRLNYIDTEGPADLEVDSSILASPCNKHN